MDFSALITRTKLWLNFNDDQADLDYTEAQIKAGLNMAYSEEVSKAKAEGSQRWFSAVTEHTWSSGEVTYTVPAPLNRIAVRRIMDVTNDAEPGSQVLFSETGAQGEVFWKDRNTLQWGSTGPGQDTTLRFIYVASPEELVNDIDVPELVPDEFHELLPLSAAILLRGMADESPPPWWVSKQDDYRLDYWKFVSRGRPLDDIPSVGGFEGEFENGVF